MYAPVILFAYNRYEHTKQTICALRNNIGATETILYVYIDAPKKEIDVDENNKVKKLIESTTGFSKVNITQRQENFGLARNIITGVSEVIERHGKAIILEDDIVTTPYFIQYMNDALVTYEDNDNVGAISGCNYPAKVNCSEDTYFLRIPLCWGWATWNDKWKFFRKDISKIDNVADDTVRYINFDDTHNYFKQAIDNKNGKLNTWFIFWYIAHAQQGLLTLFPKKSLVNNIGHDGSGQNCGSDNPFATQQADGPINVSMQSAKEFDEAVAAHKVFFKSLKKSFFVRIIHFTKKVTKRVF